MTSRTVLPLGLISLLLAGSLPAQQMPSEEGAARIQVEVSVVNVLCTVRDGKGRLITNLEKSDFEIREDGKPQKILYFAQETKRPLTLGLLVDSSVSQRRVLGEEQEAAGAFLNQILTPQDLAFLISFDVNVELLQDVTGSLDFLRQALQTVQINSSGAARGPFPTVQGGGTRLHDAIYLASTEILQTEAGRKALILLSDGQDNGSKVSREEAVRVAQKTDAILYAILFLDREFYGLGGVGYRGESSLKEMTEETGGRLFRAGSREELAEAFEQIAAELRSQYSLGYSPANSAKDGSYRRIEVKAHRRSLRVQARQGYYAPDGS